MKRLLIVLALLALPLLARADWQPKSSSLGLGVGISMGPSAVVPSGGIWKAGIWKAGIWK